MRKLQIIDSLGPTQGLAHGCRARPSAVVARRVEQSLEAQEEGSSVASQPTERGTLQDRVYGALSAEIAGGMLEPGTRLRVAHLAKRFGTSQAPIREALSRLTEEGLAATVPYLGSVVRQPSWEEIQDIYALRSELEAYAVRRALSSPQPAPFGHVRRALREIARAVRAGDEAMLIDADLEFHRQLCTLAGSALTLEAWETILRRVRGARLSIMHKHPDPRQFMTAVPTHEALLSLLEEGNAERAQVAIREHIAAAVATFSTWTEVATRPEALSSSVGRRSN